MEIASTLLNLYSGLGVSIFLGILWLIRTTVKNITTINLLQHHIGEQLGQVDDRFRQVDDRFRQVNDRFHQVDQRFDRVELRIDHLEAKMDQRFNRLESKMDQFLVALAYQGIQRPQQPPAA